MVVRLLVTEGDQGSLGRLSGAPVAIDALEEDEGGAGLAAVLGLRPG